MNDNGSRSSSVQFVTSSPHEAKHLSTWVLVAGGVPVFFIFAVHTIFQFHYLFPNPNLELLAFFFLVNVEG